jgi:hypothetical protein
MTDKRPMEAVFSFLITADGPKMTCMGCTAFLAEQGLVKLIMEKPLDNFVNKPVINGVIGEFSALYYAIADDYTMKDCRLMIRDRHIGPAWGS